MPDGSTLIWFAAAALLLLITPGPAVLYIVARSIDQGSRAGVVSSLGISAGTLFHIVAAAYGVSALLVQSALAFAAVKYLGAAYLIYLGVQKFREPDASRQPGARAPKTLARLFSQGVLVNLLNPKTALFFFAFLPQFVEPERGAVAAQILFLGLLYVALAVVTDSAWALVAGTAGQWLKEDGRFLRTQRYFAGTTFVALGLATAFSGAGENK